MSDPQRLDSELREYLEKEANLRRDERLVWLKMIFHKHFEISSLEHVVNSQDLFDIMSTAKSNYSKAKLPMKVSKRRLDSSETPHVAMIEAVISYLNKMHLLKRQVKIDYRE